MSGRFSIIARDHWGGEAAPDWIVELAHQCDRVGQSAVARKMGGSVSVINETLRNKYKGRLDNVEAKVRGAYMGTTVECPVLDEIATDLCLSNQRLPFSAGNPVRVALHKACPGCKHNRASRHISTTSPKSKQ